MPIDTHKKNRVEKKRNPDNQKNSSNLGFFLLKLNAPMLYSNVKKRLPQVVIRTSCKADWCIIYVWVLELFLVIFLIIVSSFIKIIWKVDKRVFQ